MASAVPGSSRVTPDFLTLSQYNTKISKWRVSMDLVLIAVAELYRNPRPCQGGVDLKGQEA